MFLYCLGTYYVDVRISLVFPAFSCSIWWFMCVPSLWFKEFSKLNVLIIMDICIDIYVDYLWEVILLFCLFHKCSYLIPFGVFLVILSMISSYCYILMFSFFVCVNYVHTWPFIVENVSCHLCVNILLYIY